MHVRRKLAELTDEINSERQLKTRLNLALQHANSERYRLEGKVDRLEEAYTQMEDQYLGTLDDLVHMERAYKAARARANGLQEQAMDLRQERRAVEYLLDKTRTRLINTRILAVASSCLALGYLCLYTGVL